MLIFLFLLLSIKKNLHHFCMSLSKQVCTRLKKFRQEKNFCQEYIAEKLGISVAAYSNLESGKSKISLDRIEEIASILQIDTELFFKNLAEPTDQMAIQTEIKLLQIQIEGIGTKMAVA